MKNKALELSLKSKDEEIRNFKEELKILECKNHELKTNKKGLKLELKQKQRRFDSLSAESPELANKICKQQGYAITSDCGKQPIIKMEPNDSCSNIRTVNTGNFMCLHCYLRWLKTVPKSEDLTLSANPADKIKLFSSQSELENHYVNYHNMNIIHQFDGFIYASDIIYNCTEPDSKNGTCRFKSDSKQSYENHRKLDHAKIQLLTTREIYELRKYFPNFI